MKSLLLITLLLLSTAQAQYSGDVSFDTLGIRFAVPQGWVGQETEEGFIMGSNQEAGLILIIPHQAQSLDQLISEADSGITAEGGTRLNMTGTIERYGDQAVGAQFSGTLEQTAASAYVISNLNPYGDGVTVAAITTPDQFGLRYRHLAEQVNQSIQFSQPIQSAQTQAFDRAIRGNRLRYMDNYHSADYSAGGVSGGYSMEKTVDLCANGVFSAWQSSNISAGNDGISGSDHSQDRGQGQWALLSDGPNVTRLLLTFTDGDTLQFEITEQNGGLHLDGARYYIDDADCQ